MTLVGQTAVEALSNLPLGHNDSLIFQELKLGSTPLRNKVKATLKRPPANSKTWFTGDMQSELDGHLAQQTDRGLLLAGQALESLRQQRRILPTLIVVDRACSEAVARANRRVYRALIEPRNQQAEAATALG